MKLICKVRFSVDATRVVVNPKNIRCKYNGVQFRPFITGNEPYSKEHGTEVYFSAEFALDAERNQYVEPIFQLDSVLKFDGAFLEIDPVVASIGKPAILETVRP